MSGRRGTPSHRQTGVACARQAAYGTPDEQYCPSSRPPQHGHRLGRLLFCDRHGECSHARTSAGNLRDRLTFPASERQSGQPRPTVDRRAAVCCAGRPGLREPAPSDLRGVGRTRRQGGGRSHAIPGELPPGADVLEAGRCGKTGRKWYPGEEHRFAPLGRKTPAQHRHNTPGDPHPTLCTAPGARASMRASGPRSPRRSRRAHPRNTPAPTGAT